MLWFSNHFSGMSVLSDPAGTQTIVYATRESPKPEKDRLWILADTIHQELMNCHGFAAALISS